MGSGSYYMLWLGLSPSPAFYAFPSDTDTGPRMLPDISPIAYFLFPGAVTLTSFRFVGSAISLGTSNTLQNSLVQSFPVNLHLYVNGVDQGIFATIPAGATDFVLSGSLGASIPDGALVQFVADLTQAVTGDLSNFMGSVAFN
jgi:hypothetical protein